MFETAVKFSGTTAVSWKRARKLGSSQQGKKRRASVASNWVPSMIFFAPGALLLIGRVIESLALLVDLAGELEREAVRTGRQLARERDGQRLLFRIELDRRWRNRLSIDRRARDLDLERVQDQLANRLRAR